MDSPQDKFKAVAKLKISDNKYVSGRQEELKAIRDFINKHSELGGALLIFGPCGSGKTVCMQHIISLNLVPSFHYITCYKFSRISDFFKKLIGIVSGSNTNVIAKNEGCGHDFKKNVISYLSQFKNLVSKLLYPILIVLDEIDVIDQLCGQHSGFGSRDFIIQELFGIVNGTGKVILIAISNNLELASYICGTKFSRLPFKPYNEDQLLSIITGKLGNDHVINETALKVVIRRIVNSSSDCRKCLDVFSRAISEYVYSNAKNGTSASNEFGETDANDDTKELVTPKRSRIDYEDHNISTYESTEFASEIGIQDICATTPALSVGSRDNLDAKIQSIPTIQQIILYSLVQLALTDYLEEIPCNVISLSVKHVMNELQLNESYQLSVEIGLEYLEALGIIESRSPNYSGKDDIVLIKPPLNSLIAAFNKIELFENLTVSKIRKGDSVEYKKHAYIKRPWWKRR